MSSGHVQVLTTLEGEEDATRLARSAVEARLAACAQVLGPITSVYHWQGQVETAQEWLCLLKTTADRLDELTAHLKAEHPYEVPEVIATPITGGNPDYLAWVTAETSRRP